MNPEAQQAKSSLLGLWSWVAGGAVVGIWQGEVMANADTFAQFEIDGRSLPEVLGGFVVSVLISSLVPGLFYTTVFALAGVLAGVASWLVFQALSGTGRVILRWARWFACAGVLSAPVLATELGLRLTLDDGGLGALVIAATCGSAMTVSAIVIRRLIRRRDQES